MSASNGSHELQGEHERQPGAAAHALPIAAESADLKELGIPGTESAGGEGTNNGAVDDVQTPLNTENALDTAEGMDEHNRPAQDVPAAMVPRQREKSDDSDVHTAQSSPGPKDSNSVASHDDLARDAEKLSISVERESTQHAASSTGGGSEPVREKKGVRSPSPPPPPPKDAKFLDSRKASTGEAASQGERGAMEDYDGGEATHGAKDDEIQNIMDQFDDELVGSELEKIMSPSLNQSHPTFHPPRSSSLEPSLPYGPAPVLQRTLSRDSYAFNPSGARAASISGASVSSLQQNRQDSTASPSAASAIFQPPPPSPDPEPALPFDFHRFLEQLRHRTADPVARFLRSFLAEFGKKQWMVHEQVKIISDFLEFISKKMAMCEVWRTVSDAEFDNAREGMEKLVMNRLYSQTFSPAIPPVEVTSPTKSKRNRLLNPASTAPGRKGQHQEDVERDSVIAQKIRIYGWIRAEHLDIAPVSEKGQKFLLLAQKELLKINSYRAPRDKVICVLNCCKVIFGFLKNAKSDQSADAFVPLLIYTVLRANPEHIASNVQYILRFRNQDKLGGEAGYYISSLMGVVSFVENLDRTNLTITDEEFERNVESAVSAIAEGHKAGEYEFASHESTASNAVSSSSTSAVPAAQSLHPHFSEKSTLSRPEVTSRNSTEAEQSTPRRGNSLRQKPGAGVSSGDEGEEIAAVAGLLRTIQKPLSTIGRMFSDDSPASSHLSSSQHPAYTPQPGSTPRLSPGLPPRPLQRKSSDDARQRRSPERQQRARSVETSRKKVDAAEDAAARQASAETAEAQRIRAEEHKVVVESA